MKRVCLTTSLILLIGCAEEAPNVATPENTDEVIATGSSSGDPSDTATDAPATDDEEFQPLTLGPLPGAGGSTPAADSAAAQVEGVMEALKPLQVMLGNWRGTTRKDFAGFKAVDTHEWIWDLQTDPARPALVVASDKSPYLRTARLTWDVSRELFELTATDSEGTERAFEGTYAEPVREIVGPDDKLHRVFKLLLTQTEDSRASAGGEHWQLAFVQQENNRYLLEVDRRRGKAAFKRYDTVSTQREGTSFALSDSDYGEKTCIISQGLGTIAVSYKGKSYWVCCSGCKAAFEEDPETWIARADKMAKENP